MRGATAPRKALRAGIQMCGHPCIITQNLRGTESDQNRSPTRLDKGDESPLPLGIFNKRQMEQNSPFVYLM